MQCLVTYCAIWILFLIIWLPLRVYLSHVLSEEEKEEWNALMNSIIDDPLNINKNCSN